MWVLGTIVSRTGLIESSLRHNVGLVPRRVINILFCPGLRRAGGAARVNQHLSFDCANTLAPGHSMIKQCLVSALSSIYILEDGTKEFTVMHFDTNI